jgi:hypothetical protein
MFQKRHKRSFTPIITIVRVDNIKSSLRHKAGSTKRLIVLRPDCAMLIYYRTIFFVKRKYNHDVCKTLHFIDRGTIPAVRHHPRDTLSFQISNKVDQMFYIILSCS